MTGITTLAIRPPESNDSRIFDELRHTPPCTVRSRFSTAVANDV